MDKCTLCQVDKQDVMKVYEDETLVGILHPKPANPGHVLLFPKEHFAILESTPDDILEHLAITASKISSAIFESMNIQGTNIFIQNGVPAGQTIPHVVMHIIPRTENDGVNLMWQPRQVSQEEMSTVELKIKDQTKEFLVQKQSSSSSSQEIEDKHAEKLEGEDNYLIKQLRRIP